jgi:hypothetical protein
MVVVALGEPGTPVTCRWHSFSRKKQYLMLW